VAHGTQWIYFFKGSEYLRYDMIAGFSGGHDRNHLAAVTRATSRLWSRRRDRDQVDPRRSQ
jgi:hypothetical protein